MSKKPWFEYNHDRSTGKSNIRMSWGFIFSIIGLCGLLYFLMR